MRGPLPKKVNLKEKRYSPSSWEWFQHLHQKRNENRIKSDPCGHAIVDLGDELVIDIHTDVIVYDMRNERAWKGDLV